MNRIQIPRHSEIPSEIIPWQFKLTLAQFHVALGKAVEDYRSPRRSARFGNSRAA
jgi:hypothetical protein